jgi:hypothetical protein
MKKKRGSAEYIYGIIVLHKTPSKFVVAEEIYTAYVHNLCMLMWLVN